MFRWLNALDLCRSKSLLRVIWSVAWGHLDASHTEIVSDLCSTLESLNRAACRKGTFPKRFCICDTRCEPLLGEQLFNVTSKPPKNAVGRIYGNQEQPWPFDHLRGDDIIPWLARRLGEHFCRTAWCSPRAIFPPVESGDNVANLSVILDSSNEFDPRSPCAGWKDPWIRLLHCQPSETSVPPREAKWFLYLDRDIRSDHSTDRFPPISWALSTIIEEGITCGTIAMVFASFEACTVEIFAMPRDTSITSKGTTLSDINGVTVLFLSRTSLSLATSLLIAPETRSIICGNLSTNPEVLDSEYVRHVLSESLTVLFSSTGKKRLFSNLEELCGCASQLLQLWQCRPSSRPSVQSDLFASLLLELRYTLTALSAGEQLQEPPFETLVSYRYKTRTASPWVHRIGVLYGCAVGSVALRHLSQFERESEVVSGTQALARPSAPPGASLARALADIAAGGMDSASSAQQVCEESFNLLQGRLMATGASDTEHLAVFLNHSRASLQSVLDTYGDALDHERLIRQFSQSFFFTLLSDALIGGSGEISALLRKGQRAEDLTLPANVTHDENLGLAVLQDVAAVKQSQHCAVPLATLLAAEEQLRSDKKLYVQRLLGLDAEVNPSLDLKQKTEFVDLSPATATLKTKDETPPEAESASESQVVTPAIPHNHSSPTPTSSSGSMDGKRRSAALVLCAVLLWLWYLVSFADSEVNLGKLPLQAARVRRSVTGLSALYVPEGSFVCIVHSSPHGFLRILNIDGQMDVSSTGRV